MPSGKYIRTKKFRKKVSEITKEAMNKPEIRKKLRDNHANFSGKNHPMFGIKGKDHPLYGRKCSPEKLQKMKKSALRGNEHPQWKGNDITYRVLHKWIVRNLGQPTKCERCGKDGLTGRQIGWANKDHLYKRNLDDWIRLCTKCHREYDKENNLRNIGRDELGKFINLSHSTVD